MKIIKMIVAAIVGISSFVAAIAFVLERLEKKIKYGPYGIYEKYVKRPLDAFLSTGALVVFSPLMVATAVLVRMKLGSPVLFTQERPGRDERIFKIYKFRTMTDGRDPHGELLPDEARLTGFGKALRAASLDELPELLNIIKGDMSIVGPRPLLVKYIPRYNEEQHHRHDVRPGLTGYAQAHGRNGIPWDEKFKMDVWYTRHITFKTDLSVLLATVKSVLRHEGINSGTAPTMDEFMGGHTE